MNYKYLSILFAVLFLSISVFAAAPTLSALTVSPLATTDHNYSNWKSPAYTTISTLVTGADLNKDGCGYAIDGTWTYPTATDLNTDTNTYRIIVQALAEDDTNWCITCKNNSNETSPQSCRTLYLDANAPTTIATSDGEGLIVLTSTDAATQTGNGAVVKRIYYKLDSDAWTSTTDSTKALNVTGIGSHTILFYSTDNVDNNEWVTNGAYWTKPFTVTIIPQIPCTLFNLLPLLFVFIAFFGSTGIWSIVEAKKGNVWMIVGYTISLVIGVVILISFISSFCGM
jgi:hypothetical protein